jgi:hypothetical protein
MKYYEIEIFKHKLTIEFDIQPGFIDSLKPAVVYQKKTEEGAPYLFQVKEAADEIKDLKFIMLNTLKVFFELKFNTEERKSFESKEGDMETSLLYEGELLFTIRDITV